MTKEQMLQLVNDLYCVGPGINYNIVLKNEDDNIKSVCFRKLYLFETDLDINDDSFYLSPELLSVLSKHKVDVYVQIENGNKCLMIE